MSADATDTCPCPICLEPLTTGTACHLACQHQFHSECIKQWELQSSTAGPDSNPVFTCPVCRMQNQPSGPQLRASQTQLCLIHFRNARSLVLWVTGFDLALWFVCLTLGGVHVLGHMLCAAVGHVGARTLRLWMLRLYLVSCMLSLAARTTQLVALALRGATATALVTVGLSLLLQCLLIDRVMHMCRAIPAYLEALHRHVRSDGALRQTPC